MSDRSISFYSKPEATPIELALQPRLASWMKKDHPDQVRLRDFLTSAEEVLEPMLVNLTGPLALCLDVGIPSRVPLDQSHDLDNYLYPLAKYLQRDGRHRFISIWGTKHHGDQSFISVDAARPAVELDRVGHQVDLRTRSSGSTTAFKEEIEAQLAGFEELPEGNVSMQLSYVVGTRRNWINLWKPTIDSLDRLLGRTYPHKRWNPRDGRITELGLHQAQDPALRNEVVIAVRASIIK